MTLLDMAAIGLATWRASSLMVNEAGPGGIFLWWRERLGVIHDEDGYPIGWGANGLAALFSCIWCLSVWMAALVYGCWRLSPIPIYVLAASALAVLVQEVIEKLGKPT